MISNYFFFNRVGENLIVIFTLIEFKNLLLVYKIEIHSQLFGQNCQMHDILHMSTTTLISCRF